ncbi:hypothetical protein PVK06_039253 [Gossypium arboreum]|uniref:Uncharacterized protein n=1 Tax=Gossypium arboreum TaxID=29729 RepID=A0ABR0N2E7_GOSAR|nr:hypothetical protein PVK06_039253 [Gossypium arboreum]
MAYVGFTGCYAYERMCKMSGQKGLNIDWKGLSPDLSLSSKTFAMTGALAWQALAWASFLDGLKVGTSLALDIGRALLSVEELLLVVEVGHTRLKPLTWKGSLKCFEFRL